MTYTIWTGEELFVTCTEREMLTFASWLTRAGVDFEIV